MKHEVHRQQPPTNFASRGVSPCQHRLGHLEEHKRHEAVEEEAEQATTTSTNRLPIAITTVAIAKANAGAEEGAEASGWSANAGTRAQRGAHAAGREG